MARFFAIPFALLIGCGGFEPARVGPPALVQADSVPDAAVQAANSLPCDVSALLQTQCGDCHGSSPHNGAPMSLVTYADLTAKKDGETRAVQSVSYMSGGLMPPPPAAAVSASDIAILQNWIAAGYPAQGCGNATDASMSSVTDLAIPLDGASSADFATPADLATPADFATPVDFAPACVPTGGSCAYHNDSVCCSGYCVYHTNTCR